MAIVDGNEGLWSSAFWAMDFWPANYWPKSVFTWPSTGVFENRITHATFVNGVVVSARYSPEIIHEYHYLR